METMKARRSWIDVQQTLTNHGCEPRLLHSAKLSLTNYGDSGGSVGPPTGGLGLQLSRKAYAYYAGGLSQFSPPQMP